MRELKKDKAMCNAEITETPGVYTIDVEELEKGFYMWRERAIKAEGEVERLRSLVNLCDICINRSEIPVCMPDDIEFGCGLGNDNIIQCRSFRGIEKDRGPVGS